MKYGSAGQTVPVKAGQAYIVAAKVKQTGPGAAGLLINWRGDNKWVAQGDVMEFAPADLPDTSGWRQIAGLIVVPSEADKLVFLCFARGQEDDISEAVFKDPVLLRAAQ
jgi:hypothetical protein